MSKHNPIFGIVGGRKNFLILTNMLILGVLYYQGVLDPEQFAMWMTANGVGGAAGHALEGVGKNGG